MKKLFWLLLLLPLTAQNPPTTPNIGLYIPQPGTFQNAWAPLANANFTKLDNIFGGTQVVPSLKVGTLTIYSILGVLQNCLYADSNGVVHGTGLACGGGGGGGTPAAPNGGLQYNNAGVFGGFADGTAHQVLHGGRTFGAVTSLDVDSSIFTTSTLPGSFPTLNQSTSGNAATATTAGNLNGTPNLPNGTTGTTQGIGDNTAKLATDAFVLANSGSPAFSAVGAGTNTHALVIGAGGSLGRTGGGTIDASSLGGATFAAPSSIGTGTPGIGDFTTVDSAAYTVSSNPIAASNLADGNVGGDQIVHKTAPGTMTGVNLQTSDVTGSLPINPAGGVADQSSYRPGTLPAACSSAAGADNCPNGSWAFVAPATITANAEIQEVQPIAAGSGIKHMANAANVITDTIIADTGSTTDFLNGTGGYSKPSAPMLTSFCGGAVGTGNGTEYVLAPFLKGASTACTTTIATGSIETPLSHACVMQNLYVKAGTAGAVGGSGIIKIYKNTSSAAGITCTLGTGTSCNDTTHTQTMAAGDSWKATVTTGQATDSTADIRLAIDCL